MATFYTTDPTNTVYRGVVITLRAVEGSDGEIWYGAWAGDRTPFGRAHRSTWEALCDAEAAIESAAEHLPEKMALWLNDTVHWRTEMACARAASESRIASEAADEISSQIKSLLRTLNGVIERAQELVEVLDQAHAGVEELRRHLTEDPWK